MHRYSYDNCPVCGITFTESDDVVVCPVCGTPHHRECYLSAGNCANADRHDDGFAFVSNAPEEPAAQKDDSSSQNSSDTEAPENNDPNSAFEAQFMPRINESEEIYGVPVGDLKKYIGNSWFYYIPLFLAKAKGIHFFRVNFSAFIGSYIWLFARKFYLLGAISTLITFVSYFYLYFYISYVQALGIDITSSVTSLITSSDPTVLYGYYLYLFAYNVPFILSLVTGIFGNNLYMKKCVKKVKRINKTSKTAEEFNRKLEKRGGLNMPLLYLSLALTVCYFILEQRGIIESFTSQIIDKIL